MYRTRITGSGGFAPSRVVTNEELPFLDGHHVRQETQQTETSDQWIQQRSGIRERRYVANDGTVGTSDLALEAAKLSGKLEVKLGFAGPISGFEDYEKALSAESKENIDKAETGSTMLYTSGTTGRPKGVMLSHNNILTNAAASCTVLTAGHDDLFLSFLPLSHTFERTVGYYAPIAAGCCVAHARSVQELPQDLREVRPTILVSVPRVYERFYAKLQESRLARLGWPVLDILVGRKVRAMLGGRLRFAITGGAAMPLAVATRFRELGVELLQGYGMTEAAPVVSANRPGDNDPASVGRAVPGVEVRIGANDELLVRGPNVMAGYWKRPEDTAQALKDGWLHTGDQAVIRDGRITIKGRIKDILVTSTGEKVAAGDLEMAIGADPLFAQAMVLGENRPFLAVLAVLDRAQWQRAAAALQVDPRDTASLDSLQARKMLLDRVRKAVSAFPAHATPRALWATLEPWTLDNGLMTPTLKLKRPQIEERFAAQVRLLYGEQPR